MPSFNGIDLGPFCRVKTRPNRADLQITSYPAINGLAALAMGSRGFVTEIALAAVADSLWDLGAIAATWYEAVSAQVGGTLIDSYGYEWDDVVIVDFYPTDDIVQTPGGGFGQEFHMEFLHLS